MTTEVLGEDSSGGPAKGKRGPESFRRKGRPSNGRPWGDSSTRWKRGESRRTSRLMSGSRTLLGCVMGDELDRPNPEQLEALKTLLEEALYEGRSDSSTMLAGPRAESSRRMTSSRSARSFGAMAGTYSSHLRNEGTTVLEAVKEAIAVGEGAGVPVDIIHVKIAEQKLWGRMNEIVGLIDDERRRGVNVQANVYPYTRGNNGLVTILPLSARRGKVELLRQLGDPDDRKRMRKTSGMVDLAGTTITQQSVVTGDAC